MIAKTLLSTSLLIVFALTYVRADLRSTVYELVEARSGAKSNCSQWTSHFAANGTVRSPVGSTPIVGRDGIQKHCDSWNQLLGPQGNGWYPMELWSSDTETAFQATVRAVNKGGCQITLHGIIVIKFNSMLQVSEWNHYYDADYMTPQLQGKCQYQ